MRNSGLRLYGYGVPLAALAAFFCGAETNAGMLLTCYLAVALGSLGAPDAFSRAASGLMSTRKVMGSLLIALLLIVPAAVVTGLYTAAEIGAAAALLTAARCFEELFASQNDPFSAEITAILTAVGMAACLILTKRAPGDEVITVAMQRGWLIAAGGVFLISGAIALGFSRREKPAFSAAIFREIPFALLRTALFPLLALGLSLLTDRFGPGMDDPAVYVGFMLGLILMETSKSTFRRGAYEAAGLKTGLALAMLIFALAMLGLGCVWRPVRLEDVTALVFLAAGSALLLYAPLDPETLAAALIALAAAALTALGIVPEPFTPFIGPAAALALCAVFARQWAQLHRQARARRIRRKAQGRRRG